MKYPEGPTLSFLSVKGRGQQKEYLLGEKLL